MEDRSGLCEDIRQLELSPHGLCEWPSGSALFAAEPPGAARVGETVSQTLGRASDIVSQKLGQAAEAVRQAADPLKTSHERLSAAGESLVRASGSLDQGQQASQALANSLREQVARLTEAWDAYRTRFEKVDQDLQTAFDKIVIRDTGPNAPLC